MSNPKCQAGGTTEGESKERGIFIEEPIMGFRRNVALGKFSGIYKDDTT